MDRQMLIYISGLYSGPNPSPGMGVARSLRAVFPEATLIGVDYSNRSSGIHWDDFDSIWLQRPWEELDLEEYATQIRALLSEGAMWVSGLDLETKWLSKMINHPNLLVPPLPALLQTAKPKVEAHKDLGMRIPPYIRWSSGEKEVYQFCVRYGWPVWVKGPWYESVLANRWSEVKRAYTRLAAIWSTEEIFVQQHIESYEESIAFSAYRGEFLGGVYMRKRDITPEGKTWAGKISDIPTKLLTPLLRVVAQLKWTGGAEIEGVRDARGEFWIIDWNPRFPAWIFGATISGHNLPAALVASAIGNDEPISKARPAWTNEFARVVIEVPVKREFPLPPLPESVAQRTWYGKGSLKHPSGMPSLARRMRRKKGQKSSTAEKKSVPADIVRDISTMDLTALPTPSWLFFKTVALSQFDKVYRLFDTLNNEKFTDRLPRFSVAYSVKTNPDPRLMAMAHTFSFYAETISQREVEASLSVGFPPEKIILNGPGKWWPYGAPGISPVYAIFCDSLEELDEALSLARGRALAQIIGVRLRPPQIPSRFGVPLSSFRHFVRLIRILKAFPSGYEFALHFHIQSSTIGLKQWYPLLTSMLYWAHTIEEESGTPVRVVDLGGGFTPDTFPDIYRNRKWVKEEVQNLLPNVREVIFEPGKALVQPTMGVATRVLEVREAPNKEIVVDASIAELPMIFHHPHRILWSPAAEKWELLEEGNDKIWGRLCMENDFLGEVTLPQRIARGDILIFLDAGAYDRSMSYVFGQGK